MQIPVKISTYILKSSWHSLESHLTFIQKGDCYAQL